ncbi:hypoxanthine phosphoribosyltransferase [Vicingus serpentipes]|uniref:Hypoxanthine phosphoribosyltransferase n=1 Tax=Vicingus serpentipes TaxID=1926625 RepID=A0A5C6RY44_9FLAO|nr:hypoxanthine phosphoribosyltransferase [Vicingus serpentipes]TXB67181.1 hypoxanthine phosphoribosyltransferase [Vicingus serpentipes]
METITVKDLSFKPFISEEELDVAIKKVAQKINEDYKGKTPIFLGVLNGSFMFMGDLMKSINLDCYTSFVKMASYEGTESTGKINELIGLNEDIEGKDIILVEDIVDTGNTLVKLFDILKEKNPKSIKIATLLYKPEAYNKDHKIDYVGKEIPNAFVLGYGLDYDGLGRNLSSIYVLKD